MGIAASPQVSPQYRILPIEEWVDNAAAPATYNYSVGYGPPSVLLRDDGLCVLRGLVVDTASWVTHFMCRLPRETWPRYNHSFSAMAFTGAVYIQARLTIWGTEQTTGTSGPGWVTVDQYDGVAVAYSFLNFDSAKWFVNA